jgi:nicotinic acid mononucleotide adenylyltransferase
MRDSLLQHKALLYVATTGAGLSFQYNLWKKPGCSSYLVGFFTPYAKTELQEFVGYEPEGSFVSKEVAYDLAMASYIRAAKFKVQEASDGEPVGIGITAAVATNRIPRGEQRAFICVITKDKALLHEVKLKKTLGESHREAHDQIIAAEAEDVLVCALINWMTHPYTNCTNEVLDRFYQYPTFLINSRTKDSFGSALYLPASLNPIHEGHRELARTAESVTSPLNDCKYLISTSSPHKGEMTLQEMLFKAGMLRAEKTFRGFEFTKDEPLFLDKARKRPNSIFIIGADTMERFLDPKWGPDPVQLLKELKELKTTFLVMGRVMDGVFKTANDIIVPNGYKDLFVPIEGRVDISSTMLRNEQVEAFTTPL